jgi:hypothetical protein
LIVSFSVGLLPRHGFCFGNGGGVFTEARQQLWQVRSAISGIRDLDAIMPKVYNSYHDGFFAANFRSIWNGESPKATQIAAPKDALGAGSHNPLLNR